MTTYLLPFATWAARKLKRLIGGETKAPTEIEDLSEEECVKRLAAWEEEIARQETVRQVESMSAHARSYQPPSLPETVSELLPEESITPSGSQQGTALSQQRLLLLPRQAMVH